MWIVDAGGAVAVELPKIPKATTKFKNKVNHPINRLCLSIFLKNTLMASRNAKPIENF